MGRRNKSGDDKWGGRNTHLRLSASSADKPLKQTPKSRCPWPACRPGGRREDKIAAIGIRVRRWVTYHGISLNVSPDLSHFDGIVPCGVTEHGVTSLADLGLTADMAEVDAVLKAKFAQLFGKAPLPNLHQRP